MSRGSDVVARRDEASGGEQELAARLKRGSRPRVYEEIVQQIRELIYSGRLTPGDRLLSERQMSETLGVSRTVVREALAKLASMGLIEVRGSGGAYVKEVSLDALVEPLAGILLREREAVAQLMEVRSILESKTALMAAERATKQDIAHLRWAALRVIDDIKAGVDATDSDVAFHLSLAKATHNELLASIASMMSGLMREAYGPMRARMLQGERAHVYGEHHLKIVEALAEGRGEDAERVMNEHLELAKQQMTQFFKEGFPQMWHDRKRGDEAVETMRVARVKERRPRGRSRG